MLSQRPVSGKPSAFFLEDLVGGKAMDTRSCILELRGQLEGLPSGVRYAREYENLIGEMLALCFPGSLRHIEPQIREIDNCVRRDWIAANVAPGGFWGMVRVLYKATQIVWECKNTVRLRVGDFHQAAYYISKVLGRFVILSFRGEVTTQHLKHTKRIVSEQDGLVLLLTDKDLCWLMEEAVNGRPPEIYLQDVFNSTLRAIS